MNTDRKVAQDYMVNLVMIAESMRLGIVAGAIKDAAAKSAIILMIDGLDAASIDAVNVLGAAEEV